MISTTETAFTTTAPAVARQTPRRKVRVALIGVGNCASALVQGVEFYRNASASERVPGLMNVNLGGFHIGDIEFSAAFDIDEGKVGRDLAEAIFVPPNYTIRFATVPALGVPVRHGMTPDGHDGDVVSILRKTRTDVVVLYLPAGAETATKRYVEQVLAAGCGLVNCTSVSIASRPDWQRRFLERGLPVIGDDIKSQLGTAITHRMLVNLFQERGVRIDAEKISEAVVGLGRIGSTTAASDGHGDSNDYAPGLADRTGCRIQLEGTSFGNVPLKCEVQLEVWDSPNSAGVVIDAVRCIKLALDRGIAGPLDGPSSYFMKSPPRSFTEHQARELTAAFIEGDEQGVFERVLETPVMA